MAENYMVLAGGKSQEKMVPEAAALCIKRTKRAVSNEVAHGFVGASRLLFLRWEKG